MRPPLARCQALDPATQPKFCIEPGRTVAIEGQASATSRARGLAKALLVMDRGLAAGRERETESARVREATSIEGYTEVLAEEELLAGVRGPCWSEGTYES